MKVIIDQPPPSGKMAKDRPSECIPYKTRFFKRRVTSLSTCSNSGKSFI